MMEVILEYKREGQQSTGCIRLRASSHENVLFEFEQLDFEPMLYKFAEALQENPEAAGVLQRIDRPGLVPYVLDERIVSLFRIDPVAAVKSMSVPYGSPSNTVKRVQEEKSPVTSGLRAGHTTLADAFGEELYSRYDKDRDRVECPCCGIWGSITVKDADGGFFLSCKNPACVSFDKPLAMQRRNGRWASFPTFALLATHSERFYFPRAWNDGRVWISWEGLNNKYEQFQKEKKACP